MIKDLSLNILGKSFIEQMNSDKMPNMINVRVHVRLKSMLSITPLRVLHYKAKELYHRIYGSISKLRSEKTERVLNVKVPYDGLILF